MKRCARLRLAILVCTLASICPPRAGAAADDAEAVMVYAGEGLTVRVLEWSETSGVLSGEISRDGSTFPFTGRHKETSGGVVVTGSFKAGDDSYDFTTRQDGPDSDTILFTSGGTTYRLVPGADAQKRAVAPARNPIKRVTPMPDDRGDAPVPPGGTAPPPPVLRLKQHVFPDVTMGAPAAYTVLLPTDWTSQGHIEWQPVGEVPFPQLKIELHSPQKGRVRYLPQATFVYTDAPGISRTGVPAPKNFPQWLARAVAQSNPNLGNVVLVSARRDAKKEAASLEFHRQSGQIIGGVDGMVMEHHVIVLEYDEDGVRQREEAKLVYQPLPPIHGLGGFFTQTWTVFNEGSVTAPVDVFDAHRQELWNAANMLRPTPQWHVHSQALSARLSQQHIADKWKEIKDRGEQISRMQDADFARYKRDMAARYPSSSGGSGSSSDAAQRARINGIYETDDFKDTTGATVNLPMHYHHVFSDGRGNYVLSNNSQDKPGELWTPIEPAK